MIKQMMRQHGVTNRAKIRKVLKNEFASTKFPPDMRILSFSKVNHTSSNYEAKGTNTPFGTVYTLVNRWGDLGTTHFQCHLSMYTGGYFVSAYISSLYHYTDRYVDILAARFSKVCWDALTT